MARGEGGGVRQPLRLGNIASLLNGNSEDSICCLHLNGGDALGL